MTQSQFTQYIQYFILQSAFQLNDFVELEELWAGFEEDEEAQSVIWKLGFHECQELTRETFGTIYQNLYEQWGQFFEPSEKTESDEEFEPETPLPSIGSYDPFTTGMDEYFKGRRTF